MAVTRLPLLLITTAASLALLFNGANSIQASGGVNLSPSQTTATAGQIANLLCMGDNEMSAEDYAQSLEQFSASKTVELGWLQDNVEKIDPDHRADMKSLGSEVARLIPSYKVGYFNFRSTPHYRSQLIEGLLNYLRPKMANNPVDDKEGLNGLYKQHVLEPCDKLLPATSRFVGFYESASHIIFPMDDLQASWVDYGYLCKYIEADEKLFEDLQRAIVSQNANVNEGLGETRTAPEERRVLEDHDWLPIWNQLNDETTTIDQAAGLLKELHDMFKSFIVPKRLARQQKEIDELLEVYQLSTQKCTSEQAKVVDDLVNRCQTNDAILRYLSHWAGQYFLTCAEGLRANLKTVLKPLHKVNMEMLWIEVKKVLDQPGAGSSDFRQIGREQLIQGVSSYMGSRRKYLVGGKAKMSELYRKYVIEMCRNWSLGTDVLLEFHQLITPAEMPKDVARWIDYGYLCQQILADESLKNDWLAGKDWSPFWKQLIGGDCTLEEVVKLLNGLDGIYNSPSDLKDEVTELIGVSQMDTQQCTSENAVTLGKLINKYQAGSSIVKYLKHYATKYLYTCVDDLRTKLVKTSGLERLVKEVAQAIAPASVGSYNFERLDDNRGQLIQSLGNYLSDETPTKGLIGGVAELKKLYQERVLKACQDWAPATQVLRDFYKLISPSRATEEAMLWNGYGSLCQFVQGDKNLEEDLFEDKDWSPLWIRLNSNLCTRDEVLELLNGLKDIYTASSKPDGVSDLKDEVTSLIRVSQMGATDCTGAEATLLANLIVKYEADSSLVSYLKEHIFNCGKFIVDELEFRTTSFWNYELSRVNMLGSDILRIIKSYEAGQIIPSDLHENRDLFIPALVGYLRSVTGRGNLDKKANVEGLYKKYVTGTCDKTVTATQRACDFYPALKQARYPLTDEQVRWIDIGYICKYIKDDKDLEVDLLKEVENLKEESSDHWLAHKLESVGKKLYSRSG